MEKPRWLRRVLRTVGLIGEGEMGVRGSGDLVTVAGGAVGTESISLGLAARASMSAADLGSEKCDGSSGKACCSLRKTGDTKA